MISILVIGLLRSSPKEETAEWYMKYMTLCFSSPYFSFPLEGKCHVVAKGCTRVNIPMKLTIVLLGPTLTDLHILCRMCTGAE